MLLVDHDETEIAPRQEQGRARAHHHLGRPRCDAEPHPLALALPNPRMPFRRLRLEPALDPFEKALGEGDFRQQQQHLPALRQRRRHCLEIDLGLARAGDAVDQRDREAARRHRPAQLLGRRRLLRIEGDPVAQRIGGGEGQERRQRHLRKGPLPGQAAHHPDPDRRFRRELVCPERHPRRPRHLKHPRPLRRQLLRLGLAGDIADRLAAGIEHPRHPEAQAEDVAFRLEIIGGNPFDEAPRQLRQRRQREAGGDRPELEVGCGLRAVPPHHPDGMAGAERHMNKIAGRDFKMQRHRIGIATRERIGQQHIDGRRAVAHDRVRIGGARSLPVYWSRRYAMASPILEAS